MNIISLKCRPQTDGSVTKGRFSGMKMLFSVAQDRFSMTALHPEWAPAVYECAVKVTGLPLEGIKKEHTFPVSRSSHLLDDQDAMTGSIADTAAYLV